MITSSSSGEYAFKKVFLLASKWVQETESILSTFCPPRARNTLLFRVARNKRVFALVRDTSKAQFVTRSHSNSESHARAHPKSGKFAKRGERCHDETCTRWFFIRYVTLKRCCFFQICSFFVFSRSILCLNLSLLATLVLSSEDVSYRCARARKHLQSSFLCIICSWTTPREEEISRPHRPRP